MIQPRTSRSKIAKRKNRLGTNVGRSDEDMHHYSWMGAEASDFEGEKVAVAL